MAIWLPPPRGLHIPHGWHNSWRYLVRVLHTNRPALSFCPQMWKRVGLVLVYPAGPYGMRQRFPRKAGVGSHRNVACGRLVGVLAGIAMGLQDHQRVAFQIAVILSVLHHGASATFLCQVVS